MALALVIGMLLVLAGWWAWWSRARPIASPVVLATGSPIPGPASPMKSSTSPIPASPPRAPDLVVDVSGQVMHPGVVRLPAGSRVADAVRVAGGARRGTSLASLNLARRLVDGEQIVVGAVAPTDTANSNTSASAPSTSTPTTPIDLNAATAAQLDALPGVGPVLAARIVAWRGAHGRFTSVDELRQVGGVGPKKLADLAPLVRV